ARREALRRSRLAGHAARDRTAPLRRLAPLLARTLGLALATSRLVRRRGGDALGDLRRAAALQLAPLDLLVLALALRALHSTGRHAHHLLDSGTASTRPVCS